MTGCNPAMEGIHCSTAIFRSRVHKASHNIPLGDQGCCRCQPISYSSLVYENFSACTICVITTRAKYPTVGQPDRCYTRPTIQTARLACTSKSALLHILPFYRPSSFHFLLERAHGFSLAFNWISFSIDHGSLHRRQRLHGKLGFCEYWHSIHHTNQTRRNRYQNGSY
jgi:hypothetical protein